MGGYCLQAVATAIDTSGLVKSFGNTVALNGLDLEVATGEVHGFLGPNGAGKTTAIRILLGLIKADAGIATVLGGDPWAEATRIHRHLAYVPGDVSLWPNLTGGEIIDLLGRLRGGFSEAKKEALLDRFDLDPTKKGRSYSTGNRQKVALVAALASDAELLILDEPTAGLDPLMEVQFRTLIEEDRDNGRTVLLASHILAEVEAVCDQVSIIRDGAIVESGSLDQLRHLTRTSISAVVDDPAESLARVDGIHELTVNGSRVEFEVDSDRIDEAVRHLASLGVRDLISHPPTLEELFMRHYRGD
ncbi:MAG: ABC transporter ATP-binding protein [Acidimicrobiia bacterium]|jgi:ABC-2 type transport system ATP-binding protein